MKLAERITAGDRRALARGITLIEGEHPRARDLLGGLYGHTGRAHICGITGPPGAGKSTLVQRLALALRRRNRQVAIIAIDPSSPFTGGALLGDRIRMDDALEDPGVFMRSMASRGQLGGLSSSAADVVALVDAAGFDFILVETVGAGQSEIEIMRLAHTTLVVTVPGLGDDIQADKAGILEIADIFVVNKADRDGAERAVSDLTLMVGLAHMGKAGINRWGPSSARVHARLVGQHHLLRRYGSAEPGGMSWRPPVQKTVATNDSGSAEVVSFIEQHLQFLVESRRWHAGFRDRAEERVRQLVGLLSVRNYFDVPFATGALEDLLQSVAERKLDPYAAAEKLLGRAGRGADSP